MYRQKLAVEPAAKSRGLLSTLAGSHSPTEIEPGKGKQKDHLVWLALLAWILTGEENFSAEEKGNRHFQFPVTPLLPHSNRPFQFAKNPYSSFPF